MTQKKTRQTMQHWYVSGWVITISIIFFLCGFYGLTVMTVPKILPDYDPKNSKKPSDVVKSEKLTPSELKQTPVQIPILMYHYVEYVTDPNDKTRQSLDILPSELEYQLQWLKDNGYITLFMREIPDILSGRRAKPPKVVVLTFDDGYEDFYTEVYPLLKKYNMKATEYVINNFLNRHGFLTSDQVKAMAKSPYVEIGAHSLDHYALAEVFPVVAQNEITQSKKNLESLIKMPVTAFAYPYGSFNSQVADMVKKAGFHSAVSVIAGNMQSDENLYYLYRFRAGYFINPNYSTAILNTPITPHL